MSSSLLSLSLCAVTPCSDMCASQTVQKEFPCYVFVSRSPLQSQFTIKNNIEHLHFSLRHLKAAHVTACSLLICLGRSRGSKGKMRLFPAYRLSCICNCFVPFLPVLWWLYNDLCLEVFSVFETRFSETNRYKWECRSSPVWPFFFYELPNLHISVQVNKIL